MDVLDQELMPLAEACKRLPGRPNLATLWRWRTVGVRGVKLATVLVGGRRMVSPAMLNAFCLAVTAAGEGSAGLDSSPLLDQRTRLIENEADELGL